MRDVWLQQAPRHEAVLDAANLRLGALERPDSAKIYRAHFDARSRAAEDLVLRLAGQPLLKPQPWAPSKDHIGWYLDQVFRPPARVSA